MRAARLSKKTKTNTKNSNKTSPRSQMKPKRKLGKSARKSSDSYSRSMNLGRMRTSSSLKSPSVLKISKRSREIRPSWICWLSRTAARRSERQGKTPALWIQRKRQLGRTNPLSWLRAISRLTGRREVAAEASPQLTQPMWLQIAIKQPN